MLILGVSGSSNRTVYRGVIGRVARLYLTRHSGESRLLGRGLLPERHAGDPGNLLAACCARTECKPDGARPEHCNISVSALPPPLPPSGECDPICGAQRRRRRRLVRG